MSNVLRTIQILVLLVGSVFLQVLANRYFPFFYLDFPLFAILYLTLAEENLIWTVVSGTMVGFLQDSLSPGLPGVNGFAKISVGFVAYLANAFIAVDRVITRWIMLFGCSLLSSLLVLVLRILFLDRTEGLDWQRLLWSSLLNACIGLLMFYLLDKLLRAKNE
ncbi:MAG: rod shape-determining protein MreD [Terriglobia bacterium]